MEESMSEQNRDPNAKAWSWWKKAISWASVLQFVVGVFFLTFETPLPTDPVDLFWLYGIVYSGFVALAVQSRLHQLDDWTRAAPWAAGLMGILAFIACFGEYASQEEQRAIFLSYLTIVTGIFLIGLLVAWSGNLRARQVCWVTSLCGRIHRR